MIETYTFGRILVNGVTYTHDIRIINGKVLPEWWRRSGHRVTVDDIRDILAARPEILVIGQGYSGMMKSDDAFREAVRNQGIKLIEEKTGKAVEIFNRLHRKGESVAAGFHLTC